MTRKHYTAPDCNTLQHTATHFATHSHFAAPPPRDTRAPHQMVITHCNTLQHTATHCNKLCDTIPPCCATPTRHASTTPDGGMTKVRARRSRRIMGLWWQHTHTHTHTHTQTHTHTILYVCLNASGEWYGVATISRLLKITGLFCKRARFVVYGRFCGVWVSTICHNSLGSSQRYTHTQIVHTLSFSHTLSRWSREHYPHTHKHAHSLSLPAICHKSLLTEVKTRSEVTS